MRYFTGIEGDEREIEVDGGPGDLRARIGDRKVRVDLHRLRGRGWYSLLLDGTSHDVHVSRNGQGIDVSVGPHRYQVLVEDERTRAARQATGGGAGEEGPEVVSSIMPGIVREVLVEAGRPVTKGTALLILEAMKMQNEIRAPHDAIVDAVHVAADTVVAKGDALITLKAAE